MKPTNKLESGTSFFGDTIITTLSNLKLMLGEPHYTGDTQDKVQNEWLMETNDGEVFTVYDWKTYRYYTNTEVLSWHIGGFNKQATQKAQQELVETLKTL